MADENLIADAWVATVLKDDGSKADDPVYCATRSRVHLLYLMFFSSELIKVAKGIRFFLMVITALLLLIALGVIRPNMF